MIGRTVSHYRILEQLGGGGMGVVYKAEDTKLKRLVALKFLPLDLTRDYEAKERFIHEAQAAAALDHPNICDIHEIDETDDGQIFICMAYYEGETLKKKIERGPLPIDQTSDLAIQTAQGLAKAHEHGITHRDIKPANIMVTKEGVAKIVDFGIAKLAGQAQFTKAGTTLGTAAYMSPEQTRGEDVDHRADIWSLGIVLYEMITGQLPFRGEYEQAVIYSILNETPRPVTSLRSSVPKELQSIINRCLAKKVTDRYQQMTDLLSDLQALKPQLKSGTNRQSRTQIPRIRRRRAYLYGAGVLVVLALLVWHLFLLPKLDSTDRKSVAVLPFANLSESKEDEYFSDGITEDILTQLSKISELRVISRTSIMQYKETKKSIREIGKELSVVTVLEGSVRRAGNQVRIVAQLIDARSDQHLWAETYDQEFVNIFAIQSDVAQNIAQALQAKLSNLEKERIEKTPTENLTAYEYNLRGRNYYYRYTSADNDRAIDLFRTAIKYDPNYAVAWAGLGDAYAQKFGRFSSSMNWLDSAIVAGKKAISIDPNSAEGYKALGTAYIYKGLKKNSFEVLHKAIERNPNYYPAIANLGITYAEAGELVEALHWLKKTVALNPVDIVAYSEIGEIYRRLKDFPKAEYWLNKAIEVQPDYAQTYPYLAFLLLEQGKFEQAREQVKKMHTYAADDFIILEQAQKINLFLGDFPAAKEYYLSALKSNPSLQSYFRSVSNISLGYILIKEGKRQEADKLLESALSCRLKAVGEGSELMEVVYAVSAIYAIRDNKDEACKWLKKAIEVGWRDYHTTERDPWFENLRSDDRFQEMMAHVKSQVDEMRLRVEEMEKQ